MTNIHKRGTPTNPQPWHWMMRPMAELGPAPRTCRYPIGDPKSRRFRFCGGKIGHGSYCMKHARRCYLKLRHTTSD